MRPPTMPRRPLRVWAAMPSTARNRNFDLDIAGFEQHARRRASAMWCRGSMRRGTGLMAGSPRQVSRQARGGVTVPTPGTGPEADAAAGRARPARVATIKAPWVTSGSSPASLTILALAEPASRRLSASAKETRSPRGKVTSTGSGNSPVSSAANAALARSPWRRPRGPASGAVGDPWAGRLDCHAGGA